MSPSAACAPDTSRRASLLTSRVLGASSTSAGMTRERSSSVKEAAGSSVVEFVLRRLAFGAPAVSGSSRSAARGRWFGVSLSCCDGDGLVLGDGVPVSRVAGVIVYKKKNAYVPGMKYQQHVTHAMFPGHTDRQRLERERCTRAGDGDTTA
jgi:hypothetical protein